MTCLWGEKLESEFNLQVFITLCHATTFYQHGGYEGKECVEVLDKHSGLKVLLLNLEMISVFVSYDLQYFQTISAQAAEQPPQ